MIANIIYDPTYPIKIDINFINVTSDINEVDFNIPTLIVGWKFYRNLFPEHKTSILNKKINDNLEWTFTRIEKRVDYEKDINKFIKNVFINLSNKLPYFFIDILKLKEKNTIKLYKLLSSHEEKHIYICNNSFIYLYVNHKVIGLDLEDFKYINKLDDLHKVIRNNSNNKIFYNENFLPLELKKLFYNNKIIIPYLHFLNKKKVE